MRFLFNFFKAHRKQKKQTTSIMSRKRYKDCEISLENIQIPQGQSILSVTQYNK